MGRKCIDFEQFRRKYTYTVYPSWFSFPNKKKSTTEQGDTDYTVNPFDIYIMMTDIRKTWGFRMTDRQLGLEFDETRLVTLYHAQLHSISWAYKKLNGLDALTEKFHFLKFELSQENRDFWLKVDGGECWPCSGYGRQHFRNWVGSCQWRRGIKGHMDTLIDNYFLTTSFQENSSDAHRVRPVEGKMGEYL